MKKILILILELFELVAFFAVTAIIVSLIGFFLVRTELSFVEKICLSNTPVCGGYPSHSLLAIFMLVFIGVFLIILLFTGGV
jgi:hypothetical protein